MDLKQRIQKLSDEGVLSICNESEVDVTSDMLATVRATVMKHLQSTWNMFYRTACFFWHLITLAIVLVYCIDSSSPFHTVLFGILGDIVGSFIMHIVNSISQHILGKANNTIYYAVIDSTYLGMSRIGKPGMPLLYPESESDIVKSHILEAPFGVRHRYLYAILDGVAVVTSMDAYSNTGSFSKVV